jgi:hypothetical protein
MTSRVSAARATISSELASISTAAATRFTMVAPPWYCLLPESGSARLLMILQ